MKTAERQAEDRNVTTMEDLFGPAISTYSRAQAIEDGFLVDLSTESKGYFKFPVAISRAAYEATIAAGGQWIPNGDGDTLQLPGGQDVAGRVHDVFWMLQCATRRASGPTDRVRFQVLVDAHGRGHHSRVDLYSVCGPGDQAEPVITIMLQGED